MDAKIKVLENHDRTKKIDKTPRMLTEKEIKNLKEDLKTSYSEFERFYNGIFENRNTVIKWQHEETGRTCEMPVGKSPGNRWYKISAS